MGAFDITADDIGAFSDTLGIVNSINDSGAADDRRQETYARQKTERADTEFALGTLQQGGEIPEGSELTPTSISAAKATYANQRKSEALTKGLDMSDEVLARKNEIYGKMAMWEGRQGEFLKQIVPDTSLDMQALIGVRQELDQNSKLKHENMQQLKRTADLLYQDHQSSMVLAAKYLKSGDKILAEKALMSAVNDVPHPVYMEKNANGNYDLYLEEPGKEKKLLSRGSNLTAQEAIQLIHSIPPDHAKNNLATDMLLAQEYNAKQSKPEVWSNGKDKLDVYHTVNRLNPREVQTVFFEQNGGRLDGMTMDMAKNQGYHQESKVDLGMAGKTMTLNTKKLDQLLRPFDNSIDEFGNKISNLEGAYQAVTKFDGKKDLSPEDTTRLQHAKQAISFNNSFNQILPGHAQSTKQTQPQADPFPGALDAFTTGGAAGLGKALTDIKDPAVRRAVYEKVRAHAKGLDNAEPGSAMDFDTILPHKQVETGNSSVDNGAMDIEEEPETDLTGDPSQWEVSYNGTGLTEGEYLVKDSTGNSRPMTDPEHKAYLDAHRGTQGEIADPLAAVKKGFSAMNDGMTKFHDYQRKLINGESKVAGGNPPTGKKDYGKRKDGTPKGPGFFGELPTAGGNVDTEMSIPVEIDGGKMEVPTLVPTLSQEEINAVLQGGQIPDSVIQKATEHARMRISEGKSPFAEDGEQVNNVATR